MKASMTRDEMKQLTFIRTLPYAELVEAHKLIEQGADVALLYFWFNLLKAHYFPLFKIIDVEKQAVYYCARNPEFENQIVQWFRDYSERIKQRPHGTNSSITASPRV